MLPQFLGLTFTALGGFELKQELAITLADFSQVDVLRVSAPTAIELTNLSDVFALFHLFARYSAFPLR